MDDLGSSVSRSSFAIVILTPYSLGRCRHERKGKDKGRMREKYKNIFSHHKRDSNGFKEWIECSHPIYQTLSGPNVYDKVERHWLVLGKIYTSTLKAH